jgi:hypothetical protein
MGKTSDYRTLYRGVSKFEAEFMEAYPSKAAPPFDMTIDYTRVTSWTFSLHTAIDYARKERWDYMNRSVYIPYDRDVMGYIMVLHLSPQQIQDKVVFDIGRTEITLKNGRRAGNRSEHEREVLLDAGTYPVKVYHKEYDDDSEDDDDDDDDDDDENEEKEEEEKKETMRSDANGPSLDKSASEASRVSDETVVGPFGLVSSDLNQARLPSITHSEEYISELDDRIKSHKPLIQILEAWQNAHTDILHSKQNIKLLQSYPKRMGKVKDYRIMYRGISKFEPEFFPAVKAQLRPPSGMTIKYTRPTSWTFSSTIAAEFAENEPEDKYNEMTDHLADPNVNGYILVLQMSPKEIKQQVLFDLGRTKMKLRDGPLKRNGYSKEREIILKPGYYNVQIRDSKDIYRDYKEQE